MTHTKPITEDKPFLEALQNLKEVKQILENINKWLDQRDQDIKVKTLKK
jgi:hypothetical protein